MRECLNAHQYGLTDPQGFFKATRSDPIWFIDIHRQTNGVGARGLNEIALALNESLKKKAEEEALRNRR